MSVNVYKVVSTIWHTKDNCYYEPGEIVDLSYLDGFALSALLNSGAVVAVTETAKEKKAAAKSAGEES